MLPPFLRSLKPEDVISFLHNFHNADTAVRISDGQALSFRPYIDGRVIRKLKEAKGYSTSAEILKELNSIVEDYDRNKKEDALHILDSKLAWDLTEPTEERRVNAYIDTVLEIMNVGDLKNDKKMETEAVKLALKNLPSKYELVPSDHDRLKSLLANARAKILSPDEIELLEAGEKNMKGKRGVPVTHKKINNLKKLLIYKASVLKDTKSEAEDLHGLDRTKNKTVLRVADGLAHNTAEQLMATLANLLSPKATISSTHSYVNAVRNTQGTTISASNALDLNSPLKGQGNSSVNIVCYFCGGDGHRVSECMTLKNIKMERAAKGLSPAYVPRFNRRQGDRGYTNNRKPNFKSPVKERCSLPDIMIKNFDGMKGARLNSQKAQFKLFSPDIKWIPLKGALDSGAGMTVGGVKAHENFCTNLETLRNDRHVVLPNGSRIPVSMQEYVEAPAKHGRGKVNTFNRLRVFLLDLDDWDWFLIGFPELAALQATTDQVLAQVAPPDSDETAGITISNTKKTINLLNDGSWNIFKEVIHPPLEEYDITESIFSEKAKSIGAFIIEEDNYEPQNILAIRPSNAMKELDRQDKSDDEKLNKLQKLSHSEADPVFIDSIERDVNIHLKKEQGFGENIGLRSEEEEKKFLEKDDQYLLKAIDNRIQEITDLEEEKCALLKGILLKNSKAFGLKSSPARMSKTDPIICFLMDGKAEIISQPRWMGLHKMEILRNRLKLIVDRELIRPTKNPIYGSPGFLVPKPGRPGEQRIVVDMKLLYSHTRKTPLIMPNLEKHVSFTNGATVLESFDILSGFDYLPVAEDSRKYFTIVTCFGCNEMSGFPQS
eukprot:augustus_masked-scaffold_28-processed-gene-4.111-mRNA-1 protein AED:1.00 eAED:1.00 QI:0/0/0/0/1/1/2/0/831